MNFWKYKSSEGDSSYFAILSLPFIPIFFPIVCYFALVMEKFSKSKTTISKLFFPVFVLAALLPCIGIPVSTVVTYDAWLVKFVAHERYIEKLKRDAYVVKQPSLYGEEIEISRAALPFYERIGYSVLNMKDSQEWYERKNAWDENFANPLYLIGMALGLNIPLLIVFLLEAWIGWVTKKESNVKVEEYDNAA